MSRGRVNPTPWLCFGSATIAQVVCNNTEVNSVISKAIFRVKILFLVLKLG